jgi:hypothetical protein
MAEYFLKILKVYGFERRTHFGPCSGADQPDTNIHFAKIRFNETGEDSPLKNQV